MSEEQKGKHFTETFTSPFSTPVLSWQHGPSKQFLFCFLAVVSAILGLFVYLLPFSFFIICFRLNPSCNFSFPAAHTSPAFTWCHSSAGRQGKQIALWPQAWQKIKLRKQWKASTSPKYQWHTITGNMSKIKSTRGTHDACIALLMWCRNMLRATLQYGDTHKNVCTVLPEQQLCKCKKSEVRHLCRNSSFLVRVITGGASTWLDAKQPQLLGVYSMQQTNHSVANCWNINARHWQNKEGNTQKTAHMRKNLKYCWLLSLPTFAHRIAAASCCSRRGSGQTEQGGRAVSGG